MENQRRVAAEAPGGLCPLRPPLRHDRRPWLVVVLPLCPRVLAMAQSDFLNVRLTCLPQRAIDIVQRAIDEDVKHNYQEAYVQYQNSLDYFMMAIKCMYPC